MEEERVLSGDADGSRQADFGLLEFVIIAFMTMLLGLMGRI